MAEETQQKGGAAEAEVVVVVEEQKSAVSEKETPPAPPPVPEPEKAGGVEEVGGEKATEEGEEVKIPQSASYKEETNVVGELPDAEKKGLDELKALIQDALNKHEFSPPPPKPQPETVKEDEVEETVEPAAVDDKKQEVEAAETKVEEVKVEEPPKKEEEPVVEAVVDEDGAKTVEAIEETIVSVVSASSTDPVKEAEPKVEEVGESSSAPVPEEEVKESKVEEEAAAAPEAPPPPPPEEVFIWGIPILGDEKSDVILLKFLRARDFKVKEAFTMIKNTVKWRKEFGIDSLLDEELGNEMEKVVFTDGVDKEGHPVCYNVFGAFQDKELYQNCFSDDDKRKKFLRWRIQFLEKSIRKLDFSPSGISTILQVNDLKNSPGLAKRELRQATNQALSLLQDNYPEFVFKQIFINVPWWYLAFNKMISPFLTQRTKSKFVFAGPAKSAETLFKYIAPEQVPVQLGGLGREGEQEFGIADPVSEVTIKPTLKHAIELPVTEKCTAAWELRVVGWDVIYGAEFVPNAENGYTVIVSKTRKLSPDEPIISDSFKIGEPGKIILTIDNQSSKKKLLLYRTKTKLLSD